MVTSFPLDMHNDVLDYTGLLIIAWSIIIFGLETPF